MKISIVRSNNLMTLSKEEQQLQEDLIGLNKVSHEYLRKLPAKRFNAIIKALVDGRVIIGGDSSCFHINDNGVITDCNPASLDSCWCETKFID
jgi:hypothetical protein